MQRLYPHTGNELINLWAYLCTKRFLPSIFQFLWNSMIGEEVYLVYILQTAVNILGVFFSQQFGYFVLAKQLKFCSYYLKLYTASTLKESATFKHLHAIWPNLTSGHYLTHARSHISWAAVLAWWQSWQNKKKVNETDYNYFELVCLIICPVSNHTTHIVGGFSKITRNKPL